MLQRYWFVSLVGIVLISLGSFWGIQLINQNKKSFEVIRPATGFTMENIDGAPMSLVDTKGKIKLVYFYFTNCPDVCPPTTHTLSQVQNILKEQGVFGDKTALISISFDPQHDTKDKVEGWAKRFRADQQGWYFLRGNEQEIITLARDYGAEIFKDREGNFSHRNVITLVDGENNIRYLYRVTDELTAEEIAKDMITLANEQV